MPQTHAGVDYSKWDHLDDEDDIPPVKVAGSSTTLAKPASGSPAMTDREKFSNHNQSMRLIAEWVKEAYPRISADGVTQLIKFITLQHRGIHKDNTMRAAEITAFLEAADAAAGPVEERQEDDLVHALLALGHRCSQMSGEESLPAAEKAKAYGVLTVVQGALNTLWAARVEGGARVLFDKLLKAPDSDYAKRYRALELASDCVRNPPDDPRDRPPEEPTFMTKLGRAVFMQLGVGLLMSVIVGIVFVLIAFFDPDGKVFNGPIMQILLKREGAGWAGDGASPRAGDALPKTEEWQTVEWNNKDAP